jgi:hypothetical protein
MYVVAAALSPFLAGGGGEEGVTSEKEGIHVLHPLPQIGGGVAIPLDAAPPAATHSRLYLEI